MAVRGGGHNVAGKAVTEGGVMIDLAPMRGITVDPATRTVRAQPGVTWAEFNDAAAAHGLATTGGQVSTHRHRRPHPRRRFGWLMGKHGLAIDNLVSAEVVTASGDVLTASDTENEDLFWAIRGGGGNFGVATSFEFRVHPLDTVLGGILAHPLAAGPGAIDAFRRFTADAPDDLGVACGLVHAPDGSGNKIIALPLCHAGDDPNRARADIQALRDFGPPVLDAVEVDALPRGQHVARRRLPEGCAQLLEVGVSHRPVRRCHRHRPGRVRAGAVAHERDHHRTPPRPGHPRGANRHRVSVA